MIVEYIEQYLQESKAIIEQLDKKEIIRLIELLLIVKKNQGRLFILGVGGGAGHASHAVNDFRKIVGLEAYTPTDNVSELTARVNDDGWNTVFVNWLRGSHFCKNDAVLVFSVGGGNEEKKVSVNLVEALKYAKENKGIIVGIVGRDGGYTAKVADACVIVPTINNECITPHTEGFQAVIWHLIVTHPLLKEYGMKWETTK